MLFAGGLIAFLGLVALSVDAGLIVYTRTNLQKGADAAVLAGIQELSCGSSIAEQASAEAVANDYAFQNVDNIDGLNIEASSNFVQATIERDAPSIFAGALGISSFGISAHARADIWCNGGGFGVLALNETACGALTLNGTFVGSIMHGDMIVNSSCKPNAIDVSGSTGTFVADGVYTPGQANDPGNTIVPSAVYLPPVPDPYADIDTPDVSPAAAIDPTDCTWGTGGAPEVVPPGTYDCPTGFKIKGGQAVTFLPGEYAFIGGLDIAGNSGLVTFGEGTYVFRTDAGSGFAYTGGRDIDATAGALFYNTCEDGECGSWSDAANTCTSTDTSGNFALAGSGAIDIAPLTVGAGYGDFSNVVFFQDRCSTTDMSFNGANLQISTDPTGAIYGYSAHLDYAGSASGSLQIVADTITIRGTANMIVDVQNGESVEIMRGWALTE